MQLPRKDACACKNFFALGLSLWLYDRPLQPVLEWLMKKLRNNPSMMAANGASLRAGYNFADTAELFSVQHTVAAARLPKGRYRRVTGNEAAAIGLVAAAYRAGRTLVYASYPITPASEILHELSKYKEYDVRTLQTEDEIAACGAAIGSVVRRGDRSDRHERAGPLVEGRSNGPGRDDRTAAGRDRRSAGGAEHGHAHQDGTGRSADRHVRPAWRVSAGGPGRGHACRLLSDGVRGGSIGRQVHDVAESPRLVVVEPQAIARTMPVPPSPNQKDSRH